MKALVISGGGSKGAFAGGVAQYLLEENKCKYDMFIGTSAGALLIPLLSIGKIKALYDVFTSISQSDIFNVNPFVIHKENGIYKTRINHLGTIKMFLEGKKTFGESHNLRNLIKNILTEEDFIEIKNSETDVVITVANLTRMLLEYKSVKECSYDDFCDWMWGSSNVVPFMSLLEKDGFEYADGGLGDIVPVSKAIAMGATEIDVIILDTERRSIKNPPVRNAMELTIRAFDFMLNQIENDDLLIGRMEGVQNNVQLNIYQPPENLTNNSLIFDSGKMKEWWAYGLKYAREIGPSCKQIKPTE